VGVDALGRPLDAMLLSGPAVLSIAPAGEISWQPTVAQLGSQSFSVRFTGPSGDSEDRQLAIEVREAAVNAPLGSYRVPRVWRQ